MAGVKGQKSGGHKNGGRKATGRKRDKSITLKFTEEELKAVKKALEGFEGKNLSDKFLKALGVDK